MRIETMLGFALLAAVMGACDKRRSTTRDALEGLGGAGPPCVTHRCDAIDANGETDVLGGRVHVRDYGPPCVLTAVWRFGQRSAHGFRATLVAQVGQVFPLRDGLIALAACHPFIPGGRPGGPDRSMRESASVLQDPHELEPGMALVSGDVFIPLQGEAILDSVFTATAQLVGSSGDGSAVSATLTVVHQSDPPVVHRALRTHDSFPWSDRVATLVRIVEPKPPHVVGWIEVGLSSPAARPGE